MEKLNSDLQVAIGALVVILVIQVLGMASALARVPGIPPGLEWIQPPYIAIAMFVLLFLWWRHKGGYFGAIVYGLAIIVPSALFLPTIIATPNMIAVGTEVIFSVVLIISAYRASRAKA